MLKLKVESRSLVHGDVVFFIGCEVFDEVNDQGHLVPVAKRVLFDKHKQITGYHNTSATNSLELQMQTAVRKYSPTGLLDRTNRIWRCTMNGETLWWFVCGEVSPPSWGNNYMVYRTVKIPTKHVVPPMQWAEKATWVIPLTETEGEISGERRRVPDFTE